jgi:hypothetical protein
MTTPEIQTRRLEDKVDAVIVVQNQHSDQLERIETTFHDHIKRQTTLMGEIKETLNEFMTSIEETVTRELRKIKLK